MSNQKINFVIEHIDPLGQGVYKCASGKIYFIEKTLPKEEGVAIVTSEKNGVYFATPESFTVTSEKRVTPECTHFAKCRGCHFLHTSYEEELSSKLSSFNFLFKKLFTGTIETKAAKERLGYRNRVQLHYNTKKSRLGYLNDPQERSSLLAVPNCLLPTAPIRESLSSLYRNEEWKSFAKSGPTGGKIEGHIELYQKGKKSSISVNGPYSHGGFTQVNEEGNKILTELVNGHLQTIAGGGKIKFVVDLFGGNGNLSQSTLIQKALVVDFTSYKSIKNGHQEFEQIDLYRKDAIRNLERRLTDKPTTVIIDPPRSGLKNIDHFLKLLNPEHVIYVSCNPATLKRDCQLINEQYEIQTLHLVDLFPSTYHFEAVALLKRR